LIRLLFVKPEWLGVIEEILLGRNYHRIEKRGK
jgi:hypothetical protein